ncbi:hypothetical protein [Roseateles terrae]|uniref:hypothetical protein n=1 Tax=Roseateles terrae TaxID=431060 RepID=UPI001C860B11|nr:hypothetical protein [Roseateles terrae]
MEVGRAAGVGAVVLCGQVTLIAASTMPCTTRVAAAQGQEAARGIAVARTVSVGGRGMLRGAMGALPGRAGAVSSVTVFPALGRSTLRLSALNERGHGNP